LSISTSLPQIEPSFPPDQPHRRGSRRWPRSPRRGLLAIGLAILVVLVGAGAYLFYQSTRPTTFATNFKNGQKDVPADSRILLTFSRPVGLAAVQAAFSISPGVNGNITSLDGQTQYAFAPSLGMTDLTTYTVTMKPIVDVGRHRVAGSTWSFTTLIVPHITSITGPAGTPLASGAEIDPGTTLKLNFNDAMEPTTIKVTVGAQVVDLKWAIDDRSATISTTGIASGPLQVQLSAGGRDQTGHVVPGTYTFNTGIYYHDHEHTTALRYPALIQIPNDEFARDQNGLQAADMVWEYLAEGGITRLTAMYDNAPDLIGPMRSARFISLKLGRHYKGLLFQSGESAATQARAAQDPTPQFFDTIGYQFRAAPPRYAPDNLMIKGPLVKAAEDNYFSSIPTFTIPKARPVLAAGGNQPTISVAEHYSTYNYDPAMGIYTKTEEGHPYSDAGLGQPLRIEMLITLHTTESLLNVGDGHGAHIHDYDLDSGGRIDVFYKGMGYAGTWSSTDSHGPLTFTLDGGQVLTLPPGLVWVDVTQ
jgi:Protein of unknown function (DUF3048) N-terminal domain/Protein of unknown function (DUF3048) C-terminal domain/Bacterial Ig-like domain